MLPADAYLPDGRTAADSATVRTVFIIGPDKKIRLTMNYPMSVGRNFAEIIRALDAIQATHGAPLATPADWNPGEEVIVAVRLDDAAAREQHGEIDVRLPYLRLAKGPETRCRSVSPDPVNGWEYRPKVHCQYLIDEYRCPRSLSEVNFF